MNTHRSHIGDRDPLTGRILKVHGHTDTPTHRSWIRMIERCGNPKHVQYCRYGGRGIRVCEQWLRSFSAFLADMGERPPGTSLDRYPNNDGNYEPGNCRWASPSAQLRNTSKSRLISHDGKRQSLAQWAEDLGIKYNTLHERFRRGERDPTRLFRQVG